MDSTGHSPRYSFREEIANSVIHGVGALLAIIGLGALTACAAVYGGAWHIVGCSVFGLSLILLYTASTLYHSISHPGAKNVLRAIDHSAIFLLIAGTYTPFMLVNLRGPWGWSLLAVIWSAAIAGIVARAMRGRRSTAFAVWLYVLMGWAAVAAARPLLANVFPGGLILLLLGGLAYTGGVVFYLWRRLPYHHAVWHGFALLGSAFHYFAVLFYVIPLAKG